MKLKELLDAVAREVFGLDDAPETLKSVVDVTGHEVSASGEPIGEPGARPGQCPPPQGASGSDND